MIISDQKSSSTILFLKSVLKQNVMKDTLSDNNQIKIRRVKGAICPYCYSSTAD